MDVKTLKCLRYCLFLQIFLGCLLAENGSGHIGPPEYSDAIAYNSQVEKAIENFASEAGCILCDLRAKAREVGIMPNRKWVSLYILPNILGGMVRVIKYL